MVFFAHIDSRLAPAINELGGIGGFFYWRIHNAGRTGVEMFFVLSGFLIGGLLFSELKASGRIDTVRFWMRRGFKIWPSYYILLLILGILGTTGWIDTTSVATTLQTFFGHILFFQNYLPDNPNGPTWSLAIEEHFYIFLPLLLWALIKWAARRGTDWRDYVPGVTLAIVVICLILRAVNLATGTTEWDFARTHNRMDALMIGVYCRFLVSNGSNIVDRIMKYRIPALVFIFAVVLSTGLYERFNPAMFTVGFLLISIAYALLLLLVYGGLLARFEEGPVLKGVSHIGNWSYNIYLWHAFVPLIPLPGYEPVRNLINSYVAWVPGQIALQATWFIGCSILVGYVMTKVVEGPFLKLRDRWFPSTKKAPDLKTPA